MNKLTSGTLTPAYGRDYTNGRDARADFEAGKDFVLHTYGGAPNQYANRDAFAPGVRLIIRFKAQRSVVAHVVGSTVPAKKARKTAADRVAIVQPEPAMEPARAFRVDVYADDSGKPAGNALRFATRAECNAYARDLASRWFLVRRWDVVETPGPALHEWTADGQLRSL